ncbi:MAG: hypothetical protein ACRYFA_04645 [Janthinobacterium lividum]
MKKCITLTVLLFLCSKISFAQLGYNYSSYSVGLGGGVATADADLNKKINKIAFFGTVSYNYSPFVTFTGEFQVGKLAGGNTVTDKDTRAFVNNFKALNFYADLQMGELIDYKDYILLNVIKNIYVGTGIGVIYNKMAFVQRVSLNNPGYVFPGQDASTELMIPLRIGYEFKLYDFYREPSIRINVGYQMNLAYGEGLDGYNDQPQIFDNHHVDRYSLIGVGVKYGFGRPVSYRKPIHRF